MRVLVTGSSGFIGSALVNGLTASGHYVVRLVRGDPNRDRGDIVWDPVSGNIERAKLNGIDAVVHLAGENVFGPWTKGKKERIFRSRVPATEHLVEALAGLAVRPRTLICASGVGFYGDAGTAWVSESSPAGQGFLAEVCQDWERATDLAVRAGIRTVNARLGIVLSHRGGALAQMLPMFKAGMGGRLGHGRQFMSWIELNDLVSAMHFVLTAETLSGPCNFVAPASVSNQEFTQSLGRILRRPTLLPVPSFMLKALPGGMGRELLLYSCRAAPEKLLRAGFKFSFPDVDSALEHAVGG